MKRLTNDVFVAGSVSAVALVNSLPSYAAVAKSTSGTGNVLSYGTPQNNSLEDNIKELSQLIGENLENEYEEKEEKIKDMIEKRDWNYEYTIQSFYDQKSPYSNVDYAAIIAAYGTAIQCGRGDGPLLSDLKIFDMKVTATDVPDENSDEKYGKVVFSVKNAEEILNIYGYSLSNEKTEKIYEYRYRKINEEVSNETIRKSISVLTPEGLSSANQRSYEECAAMLPDNLSSDRRTIVMNALALLGKVPYEWGGKPSKAGYDSSWWSFDSSGQQKGLDCSGFVQWVFMTSDYPSEVTGKIYGTASINKNLVSISESQLQPGDIGLLNNTSSSQNHTGIYLGNGLWIHCSSGSKTVVVSNYNFKYFKAAPLATASGSKVTYKMTSAVTLENKTSDVEEATKAKAKSNSSATDNSKNPLSTDGAATIEEKDEETNAETSETGIESAENDIHDVSEDQFTISSSENNEEDGGSCLEETSSEETVSGGSTSADASSGYSENDVTLMAQLMTSEAIGEGEEGMAAVGEVVMNRVASSSFPDTISEVIFQRGQFAGASSIKKITPSEKAKELAREVINGSTKVFNNKNVLYFCNSMVVSGVAATENVSWNGKAWYTSVGNHAFYVG